MKKAKAKQKPKAIIKAWGGFYNDKLDTWSNDGPGQLAIWTTRREARKRYEGVRRVEIRVAV